MLAALYDIHGNLPALDTVLAAVRARGVTRLVIGGDVVPGPMPRECLERLRALELPITCIRGNGERAVLAVRRGEAMPAEVPPAFHHAIRWNAREIDDGLAAWMADWPLTARQALPAVGEVMFCHATPRNDLEIFTVRTADERLAPVVAGVNADLLVCGHTHMQFDRQVGALRVMNAGSVGMPFQAPGAYWLEIDDRPRLAWSAYDREAAAARIRATAYPQAEVFAAQHVVTTPSEEAMLDALSQSELRS